MPVPENIISNPNQKEMPPTPHKEQTANPVDDDALCCTIEDFARKYPDSVSKVPPVYNILDIYEHLGNGEDPVLY